MSKGSRIRQRKITEAEWFANWERVYGKKKNAKTKERQEKDNWFARAIR